MRYDSIRPGEPLLDTNGKRVQAHGGSIFYENGTYYFYGENKEYTTYGSDIWTYGVRAYASRDLYNWEDKGLIIHPDEQGAHSPLNPRTAKLDRPHILYCKKTGKYVCWVKVMRNDGSQTMTVLQADSFLGEYEIVRKDLKPLNMYSGDFDLVAAPDGKAYIYFERVHSQTICADLTDDYTDVTGYYSTHFSRPYPPYVREATAYFVRNHKHYLVTSGTTSYLPNPSEVAVADTWHGPYTLLGNPHPTDESRTSFHSQISSVFQVPGKKDLYIALADRWAPDCMDIPYEFCEQVYVYYCTGRAEEIPTLMQRYRITPEIMARTDDEKRDTSIAEYVWLPLRFVEPDAEHPYGQVLIEWLDEWRIEDFE